MTPIEIELPAEERCARFTEALGVDPIGSAGHYHSFVLVEVDLPWPSEITDARVLGGFDEIAASSDREIRVLGIVPRGDRGPDARRIVHYHRPVESAAAPFAGVELVVDAGDEIETIAAMISEPASPAFTPVAGRDLLICTHGSRDVCCGGDGMRLHQRADGAFPGVRVRRCSHTGGHRYAPTAITFPDGRFWAHLDLATLRSIVQRTADPEDLRSHHRGWSAADGPGEQAAEREMFVRVGWPLLDREVSFEVVADGGGRTTVRVSDGVVTLDVTSELARDFPALVCGDGPDPSGKTFPEFRVVDVVAAPGPGR